MLYAKQEKEKIVWTEEKELKFQEHKKLMRSKLYTLAKGDIYNSAMYGFL